MEKEVSFHAFLGYLFHHSGDFRICKKISQDVEAIVLKKDFHSAYSIQELYRKIALSSLKDLAIEGFYL